MKKCIFLDEKYSFKKPSQQNLSCSTEKLENYSERYGEKGKYCHQIILKLFKTNSIIKDFRTAHKEYLTMKRDLDHVTLIGKNFCPLQRDFFSVVNKRFSN